MPHDYSKDALYNPETKPVFVGVDRMPPFDDQATDFSLVNAWWFSNMSHLSYLKKSEVEQALKAVGFQLDKFFLGKSTQGFLATNDHTAVLVFRGTESKVLADLKTIARFSRDRCTEGTRVHKGFLRALDEVWDQVAASLDALEDRGVRVWHTGHSLGAALATLSAARRKPNGLVTFASPRVGDEAFTDLLQAIDVHRFVNCTDIVTMVPPKVIGYMHVGRLIFFTDRGKLLTNPGFGTRFRHKASGVLDYAARFPWFRRGMVKMRSSADHAILNYTEGIRRALKRDAA